MKKKITLFVMSLFVAGFAGFILNMVSDGNGRWTLDDFREMKQKQKQHRVSRHGEPDNAMKWFIEQRAFPNDEIPADWRNAALEHIERHNNTAGLLEQTAALNWTQLGPKNVGGRIRAIVVHPSNNDIIYAASVSGGVWKTTNGGNSWQPLKDNMENLAVCSMVMDPGNANIIYAGTGEGFYNGDAIRGAGIFKTTDAGASWIQLSSTTNEKFYYVNKLVFDASTNSLWAATRKGLYRSTDGGSSFTALLENGSLNDIHCTDVEISHSASPSVLYCSFGIFNQSEIWRSTDAGSSWNQIYTNPNFGRIELAASKQNPNDVFASCMDLSNDGIGAMLKSTNRGDSWQNMTIPGPNSYGEPTYAGVQGWYNNILAVSPNNGNKLYVGGIDFWVSTDKGTNWQRTTDDATIPGYSLVHVDHHAIAIPDNNPNIILLGTDGGFYKSIDGGYNFNNMNNNFYITQFYYGDVHPTGTTYYGGTQDNGTIKTTGSTNWTEVIGGDGGVTRVNWNNTNVVWGEYVRLLLLKSTDGGTSWYRKMNGIPVGPDPGDGTTDRVLFIAPYDMSPNDPNTLVAGTYKVYRTTDGGENWSAISDDLTGDGAGQNGAKISWVTIAHGNNNVLYAGCSNGRVLVTTDGGSSWYLRNANLPALYVTRIISEPNQPAAAYVLFSGFNSGEKIFKTTDYGQSWVNKSSNLPNLPVNDLVINPDNTDNLFIATDLGVFSTTNGGGSWIQESAGLPNVVVSDLTYRPNDGKIFAFTHGRSLYSAPINAGGVVSTLQYDDGTPTSGYFWPNTGQGSAVTMTPPQSNVKVLNIQIYFTSVESGSARYKPVIYDDDYGFPNNSLADIPYTTAASVPGWDEVNIESYNIYVNTDFYVGLTYDGTNTPVFGYDPVDNNRAWDYDGTDWAPWGETYFMRAQVMTATGIHTIENRIPESFELSQNYPNPFNPSTTIRYAIPEAAEVSLIIYDLQGRKIAELVNNRLNPGTYEAVWNGRNENGLLSASGIYIYTLQAGNIRVFNKMILLR